MNKSHHEIWRFGVITVGDVHTDTHHMGFVLNQNVINIDHKDISRIYNIKHALPRCNIYCGGPVMTDRCTVIHSTEYTNPETRSFNSHISLTFNDQIIQDISQGHGPKHWKIMLGHCQWEDGQLDAEIIRPGGWLLRPWHHYAWGGYKRKDKMWRRLIEIHAQQDAKSFLDTMFNK
jgi:putative AlgH/UPF0301 family transcriptional regulator